MDKKAHWEKVFETKAQDEVSWYQPNPKTSVAFFVDNAIAKVPDRLKNDSGLNYDRLKWRRKRGRVDSSLETC